MPPSTPKSSTPAPPPELPAPSYPALESLIEQASPDEVQSFFSPVKAELADLKGPRAEQGKKAQVALSHAEELLNLLLDTRERLLSEAKGGKGRK